MQAYLLGFIWFSLVFLGGSPRAKLYPQVGRYPFLTGRMAPTVFGDDGVASLTSERLASIFSRNWRALSFQVKRMECSRACSRDRVNALRHAALRSSSSTPAPCPTTSIGPGTG